MFQVKTLPADRPTGLDPLPHMIGKFPAATNGWYMWTDVLAELGKYNTKHKLLQPEEIKIDDDKESRPDLLWLCSLSGK